MTNWLENLCDQMDLAAQPRGPITQVFQKQSRGLEKLMNRGKVHPKLFTHRIANGKDCEVLPTLSLRYFMTGIGKYYNIFSSYCKTFMDLQTATSLSILF